MAIEDYRAITKQIEFYQWKQATNSNYLILYAMNQERILLSIAVISLRLKQISYYAASKSINKAIIAKTETMVQLYFLTGNRKFLCALDEQGEEYVL